MFDRNRREFLSLLGAAVTWPLAARAQQPAMPALRRAGRDRSEQLVAIHGNELSRLSECATL
jgi:hypothetical protein